MSEKDLAHKETDKILLALEQKINRIYANARDDMSANIAEYFASFKKREARQRKLLEQGKITEQEFKQWRLNQMARGERYVKMRDEYAERMTNANEVATAYINDTTPSIYSLNRNYSAYTIEQVAGDVGFTLYDERTVKRLIKDEPNLMPYYPPKKAIKRGIDLEYGKQKITENITSGILQGKSIPNISKSLQQDIPTMNRNSAIRTARTAATGAQNAGRMDSYHAAKEMGIKLKKQWLATLDGRTRHEHAMLDGQAVDEDKPFKVDGYEIMFPGDPSAAAEMVYNCRCTTVAQIDGVDMSDIKRRAVDPETGETVLIENMTYAEWAGWKEKSTSITSMEEKTQDVILTSSDTIEKAKDFAKSADYSGVKSFQDVRKVTLDNLGYSGLPQVVEDKAFADVAKESTVFYRGVAPSADKSASKIADEFKNGELWTGNSGGAAYGNGVYFSPEKTIAKEYADIDGEIIEMAMDKSAKIVDYETIYNEFFGTGIPTTLGDKREDYHDIIADVGQYAAMKGYDAIDLNGYNGNNHLILLNRTKAIVKGGK